MTIYSLDVLLFLFGTKRWQEYTELYRKDLHNPDNHDGVITDLEPDVLECEVQFTFGESHSPNKGEWDKLQLLVL